MRDMQRVDEVMMENGWKGDNVEISPNCPRCGSCNTKFCYYNNYSLTQPRYFCKACRRYWTKGGSLRNVPVGGGCRKSRRGNSKTSSSSMHPPSKILTDDAHKNCDPIRNNPSSDAPNIDLALVYANFLNQKAEPDHSIKAYNDDDACVENTYNYSSEGPGTQVVGTASTTGTGCLRESQLSSGEGNQMYFYGSMCMHKNHEEGIDQHCNSSSSDVHTMNFELPPLPGEEASAGLHFHDSDMMWSSNSAFCSTHVPPQPFDADLLFSDWSHFDFPRP